VLAVAGVNSVMGPSGERALVQSVTGLVAGGIAFVGAAKLLRVEELGMVRSLLPGRSRTSSGLG
jgi:hypothetical protein